MTEALIEAPAWWRACTLAERCVPDAAAHPGPAEVESPHTADRRLREWREQSPFQKPEWFSARLAHAGLDETTFRRILGESAISLARRIPGPPPWVERLREAYAQPADEGPCSRLPVVGSLLAPQAKRLAAEAAALAGERADLGAALHRAADDLMTAIIVRTDQRLSRAVVLELRVAALRGTLRGTDPEARFQAFMAGLKEPENALVFLQSYPVLGRLLVSSIDDWTEAATELLRRLAADWEAIGRTFWPGREPGALTALEVGLGDQHRRGRTVCLLRFAGGAGVLYKPRPMSADVHFTQLVEWLAARGGIDLRVPVVLDRGDYGWTELIAHAPCPDRAAAHRFYARHGALLAILYVLNASDLHRENLVAAGEHPVPVDLEMLCEADYGQLSEEFYDSHSEFEIATSVVRTLLLPYFQEGKGRTVLELSGLGGAGGQLSVNLQPEWHDLGTDRVALASRRAPVEPTPNRPMLAGQPLNAIDFAADIERGFRATYRLLSSRRHELLANDGPLAAFREDRMRMIFRATGLYSLIVGASFHPDCLRDALERERILDRLWFGSDRTVYFHACRRLLESERHDLWHGDVPYFTARADSRDLKDSQGRCLPGLFRRSGWEVVVERCQRLSEDDLAKQASYIRASLTTLAINGVQGFERYPAPRRLPPLSRERLLAQAVAIGKRIVDLALWHEGHASWIGLACGESAGWHLRAIGVDLYSGLPGIILFLVHLRAVTGVESFDTTVAGALAALRRRMWRQQAGLEFIGGYDGWGGLLYLWLQLAHLWQEEGMLSEAKAMVPRMAALAAARDQEHLDVIQGAAGAIVPLLQLHALAGFAPARDLALQLGDLLLARSQAHDGGTAWIGDPKNGRPFTGFSHGASGIAWSLTELFAATGERRYAEKAAAAVAFERSHFSAAHGNWEDLRLAPSPGGPSYMAAWCTGACGIGLSRWRMREHLGSAAVDEDFAVAAETTYREGFGSNHSLCHGDLGALELLAAASHTLPPARWRERLAERAAYTLASIEEHHPRSGVPLDVETPGLMDGLAGIGYGLLRLAAPELVPSVLLLEAPRHGDRPASAGKLTLVKETA